MRVCVRARARLVRRDGLATAGANAHKVRKTTHLHVALHSQAYEAALASSDPSCSFAKSADAFADQYVTTHRDFVVQSGGGGGGDFMCLTRPPAKPWTAQLP